VEGDSVRSLREHTHGVVDLGVVLMIGIAFAALVVISFIIFELQSQLVPTAPTAASTSAYNMTYNQVTNITEGWDDAIALILVAITVFILALAISALLMLRGR